MATIDLTLNAIKIPALDGYTPPFGVKKVSGGLTTQEVNDNVIAPFVKERPIEITEDSSTGSVEYNASLVINSADAVLTLGSGTYVGCTVKVIAATAGSVSYNSGTTDTLVAGQIVNYIWTGSAWISDIALVHKSIASADNELDIDKKDVHATYSTTEQLTGDYWTDGKPIYKKTYSENVTTYADGTKIRSFSYVEDDWRLTRNLIKADGYMKVAFGSSYEIYSFGSTSAGISDGTITVSSRVLAHPTNNRLYLNAYILKSDAPTAVEFNVTIYYTKTTD